MSTLTDLQAELAEVKTALAACRTNGQGYSRTGLTVNRVQYNQLLAHKKQLEKQIVQIQGKGGSFIFTKGKATAPADGWDG